MCEGCPRHASLQPLLCSTTHQINNIFHVPTMPRSTCVHTQVFGHIRAHPHAWHACSTHVDLSHACPCQKCPFSDIRVTCVLHACRMRPHAWHACSTHVDACNNLYHMQQCTVMQLNESSYRLLRPCHHSSSEQASRLTGQQWIFWHFDHQKTL